MQMQHLETRLSLPYVIGTVSFSAGELLFAAVNPDGLARVNSLKERPFNTAAPPPNFTNNK
ncbi:MAG: hypothetical protein OXC79_10165 [Candidatus Poribacteria bacterium]|nr:hypothetical protein [Candidatus Poribacteria bacterium]